MFIPRFLPLAILAALGACGDRDADAEGERKTAAGEVLGGSISDAMLPLDTVQSQSPPLREAPQVDPGAPSNHVGTPLPAADTPTEPVATLSPQAEN